jgi:hypothetical protein
MPFPSSKVCMGCGKDGELFQLVVEASGTTLCPDCLVELFRGYKAKLGTHPVNIRNQRY